MSNPNIIVKAELYFVNLKPEVTRTDAIQSFVSQETPILKLTTADNLVGVGYSYTIGTGGSSIIAMLKDHLIPQLIGRDASMIEEIWSDLLMHTHATSVGAITSLSLAVIDIALWDLKCQRYKAPLYKVAGGKKEKIKLYSTEGGWLHLSQDNLVAEALTAQQSGFIGSKIKIGLTISEDYLRLKAIRDAVGPEYKIYLDCNQAFYLSDIKERIDTLKELNISWIEEPFLAHDINSHTALANISTIPIAVGESIYSVQHFKEYLHNHAADIIQVDVARIGGITPWLKVAHMAECFNKVICPHFLMELHVSLCCAINNSLWLEYIPQLTSITCSKVKIKNGYAYAPHQNGIGIDWHWENIGSPIHIFQSH